MDYCLWFLLLLQFVLKHKEFCHLREVAMFPNTVNPHKKDSLKLVIAMIEQVMALHDDLRWFHIGCDEVMLGNMNLNLIREDRAI